jgi:tetratricopeptide (TPR) repeat protein
VLLKNKLLRSCLTLALSLCVGAMSVDAFAQQQQQQQQPAQKNQRTQTQSTPRSSTPFEVRSGAAGSYLAGLIAGADRDTLAAATFFREALRQDPRNRDLAERAFIASLTNGDMREAVDLAQRLVKADSRNALIQMVLAARSMRAKQWAQAREELGRAGGGRQRDLTAMLLSAWTIAGAGDVRRAVESIDRLNDERFDFFRQFHIGLMLEMSGQAAEAGKRFKAAYEIDNTSLRIVDAYARSLARRGDREEARKVYLDFDRLLPRHPTVRDALQRLDRGETLEPIVRSAAAGAAEVLFGLGLIGSQQNDTLVAMVYLRLALYLAPDHSNAAITLGDSYERVKQYERALDAYDLIPESSPLYGLAEAQTGLVLEAMGKAEEATKHLEGIVARRPKDIDALSALGNVQRSRKLYKESAETFTRVIDLVPEPKRGDWTLFYFRGIAYERSKQWPKAEPDFKKALELFPEQPLVLNYLGYSWVDQGIHLEEGEKLLRRAVELRPEDGYIIDSLGWVHYRLGRYEEAVRELERAVDIRPGDPVINDHLGDAYWRVGRKLEAYFQWNHARDLNPEPEDLERILKKIANGLEDDPKPATASPSQGSEKNGG